ncbi:MAG TPA: SWIM zinc finger family protein, partial [Myxococcaceae bacterium]|nr:SWIM zinc finger family protein [Myxococcaceae bacterium]
MDPLPEPESVPASGHALIDALRTEVQPTSFKKGRDGAREGRVLRYSDDEEGVRRGEVAGSSGEVYQVEVGLNPDGSVKSSCSCPAWGEYGPHCKHAVALAYADRAETLAPPQAPEPGRPADVVPLPALAKLESWLGLSAAGEPSFVYRLAPAHPRGSGRSWLFDVRRRAGKDGGPLSVKRFLSGGTRLSPADERAFGELARHESRFDGKFILTDDDIADLLPLLRTRRLVYRGTGIQFTVEPARPQIHLSSMQAGARAQIEFQLPDGRSTAFETSVLLIGRRSSMLLETQTAYPLEPDLPARMWRAWMREPSMSFPVAQVERALSFFAAHLPRIDLRLRADGLDVVEDSQPVFLLTVEGSAEKARVQLAARYATASVPVSPTAVHLGYAASPGGQGRTLFRRQEIAERAAAQVLLGLGFKYDSQGSVYEATGDAA